MQQDQLIKKLLYRSCYRGCKETDFLIGNFAKSNIKQISDLELYANFLNENDGQIYDWIMQKTPTPEKYQDLIAKIQEFHEI